MNVEKYEEPPQGLMRVPIMSISRHRLGLDGDGVTTLVAFYGCNLRCKYCINPECFKEPDESKYFTPQQLLDKLMQDDVYFRSTGGGITFGGGEPGLYADFIKEFHRICPPQWMIRIETALQFFYQKIGPLAHIVDEWIVDLKTAEEVSYREYTGGEYMQAVKNLHNLFYYYNLKKERFKIRIPIIPGYTTRQQAEETMRVLRRHGFTRFDIFEYVTERPQRINLRGKEKCEVLKEVRRQLAEANDIELPKRDCSHEGDCLGTCPLCQQELQTLSEELAMKEESRMAVKEETIQRIDEFLGPKREDGLSSHEEDEQPLEGETRILDGMPMPPPDEILGMETWRDEPEDPDDPDGPEDSEDPDKPDDPEDPDKPDDPEDPDEPDKSQQVLFKECAVAGVSYHLNAEDELWQELEVGMPVALVRDRHNAYDEFAVAIALPEDYDGHPEDFDFDLILGYLPRHENEEIAKLLDMGWEDSLSASLSTVKRTGKMNERLRVAITLHRRG
jgi:pyruvate formate lyase activating enzyme